ncbi:actin-like ATPase domain-containing protein [Colletotrichum zoysiae]|uniref:Actin-like ATPase domain-containing protein n=1 Tax=Colletotrichum zoysiae TaxID=1216348 RepID=A0AAD9H896_9PEZI|nr:actin-like ATPase domain-containing protein [Colletotrichum zoysiae]
MADNEDAIVIGIDFGTTFSGVSWAFSGQPNDIEVIMRWESDTNYASDREKAPTAMLYRGAQSPISWGYEISVDEIQDAMRWFKLLLIDEADLPENLRRSSQILEAKNAVKAANKDPVDIISSYIQRLWNHSVESIGISAGDEFVKMCKFHVVITLPAIWPDYAKSRMRRAAENAGLLKTRPAGKTTLAFISEPEAAALATMRDLSGRPNIKVGDHFVVCDAGGGTVDLISYEVLSLKPMVVREAIKGDGELCGGVFLDEAFVRLIKNKVTPQAWDNVPKDEAANVLNGDWEHGIKQQFDGQDREWHIKLPPGCRIKKSSGQGVKRKRNLMLNLQDLLSIFDPIATQISSLVQKQIDSVRKKSGKHPKNVVLVGGFGRCRYLHSHLQSVIDKDITLLQSTGAKPWTAICRGAVIQGLTQHNLSPGLSVNVKSRIARVSYGVSVRENFDKKKHSSKSKIWCKDEQKWLADDQMNWFLKQGTDVSSTDPVREEFYRLYTSPPPKISDSLHISSAWPPPSELDDSVKELCEITWNKKIDFEALPRHVNSLGKVFHELTYEIEMICAGTSIDFSVIHNGKHVGAKNVSVVFDAEEDNVKPKRSSSP